MHAHAARALARWMFASSRGGAPLALARDTYPQLYYTVVAAGVPSGNVGTTRPFLSSLPMAVLRQPLALLLASIASVPTLATPACKFTIPDALGGCVSYDLCPVGSSAAAAAGFQLVSLGCSLSLSLFLSLSLPPSHKHAHTYTHTHTLTHTHTR